MNTTLINAMPSATPTEGAITAWKALSRDEQLKRLRALFHRADCDSVSSATMTDLFTEARRRSAFRRG
jgi:hypothetical protein